MKGNDGKILFLTIMIFALISVCIVLYIQTNFFKVIIDFFVGIYNGMKNWFV